MEEDWDLHAVVRSCSSSAATTATTSTAAAAAAAAAQNFSSLEQDCSFNYLSRDPFDSRRNSPQFSEDLHELWKPFFPKSQILPISPLSVLQDLSSDNHPPPPPPPQQEMRRLISSQKQPLFSIVNGSKNSSTSHHPNPRSKKRKNHSKKVCHVPAESLSSDMWSWRKYGQKPIKGSPYPRGYYRCSTSKGCMARKQVERNRSDPGMFIITYTGDHNHAVPTHRNSLAGSTRHKPAAADPEPSPPTPEKPDEELGGDEEEIMEGDGEGEGDDDFFAGLEDFAGDFSPENPWLGTAAAAATKAAGGGLG